MSEWHRRDVIIAAGAVVGTCAVIMPTIGSAAAADAPSSDIVVCDMRFAASRRFAEKAAKAGTRVVQTQGDVTDFWHNELDLLWGREKVALSGLTERPAFFYLARLGMDRGLRVISKSEQGRLIRWTIAPMQRAAIA